MALNDEMFTEEEFKFGIGDAIEIKRGDKTYRTLVENQIDADTLLVYMPMEKAKPVLISKGEVLSINYVIVEQELGKYIVYAFDAIVEDRLHFENIPMMKVRALQKPRKIQRRDFFRLNIVKPLLLEKEDGEGTIEVITKDISAGGMYVISPKPMREGDKYLVYINMIPESPMVVSGTVLSSEQSFDDSSRYRVRFYFADVDKKVQRDLMKQINQLQLLELRRLKHKNSPYDDAIKGHVYDELLDRFNADSAFDTNMRYLSGLSILLFFLLVASFITSMPQVGWKIPLFGQQAVKGWDVMLLKINTLFSGLIIIISSLGLYFDRRHYGNVRKVNMLYVSFFVLSLLAMVGHLLLLTQLS